MTLLDEMAEALRVYQKEFELGRITYKGKTTETYYEGPATKALAKYEAAKDDVVLVPKNSTNC